MSQFENLKLTPDRNSRGLRQPSGIVLTLDDELWPNLVIRFTEGLISDSRYQIEIFYISNFFIARNKEEFFSQQFKIKIKLTKTYLCY